MEMNLERRTWRMCVLVWKYLSVGVCKSLDTTFGYVMVPDQNSQTALILFLNFQNCAREKVLKFIFFSPFT